MAEESNGNLARERTEFAEDRTVLANERTFSGWLRTGYACIGIGLAFMRYSEGSSPAGSPS